MRTSIVTLVMAGGLLALGACGTTEPIQLTQAERDQICHGVARTRIVATGRQTGDVRSDYECRAIHSGGVFDRADRNVGGKAAARSAATDRALRGGR